MNEQAVKDRASLGDATAQYQLAIAYRYGLGALTRDNVEAVKWFEQAAELGHVEAQINMGLLYQEGVCVAQDLDMAVHWYSKASAQGSGLARIALGDVHRKNGDCSPISHWFDIAVEQGERAAHYKLGNLYDLAAYSGKDTVKSALWYVAETVEVDIQAQMRS